MFVSVQKGKKYAYFGVFTPISINSVINKEGEVIFMFNSQSNAEQHVEETLKILNGI